MDKWRAFRYYLSAAAGFIPLALIILIIFLARESLMDNIRNYGVAPLRGPGEPLLQKQMFVRDRYHRRDIVDPDEVVEWEHATVSKQTFVGSDLTAIETTIELDNGDVFHHTTVPFSEYLEAYNFYKLVIHREFKKGWVTYYDPDTEKWVKNKRLRGGLSFPRNLAFVNIENERFIIFDQTYAYSGEEDGSVTARDDIMGTVHVSHRGYGYDFIIGFAMEEGVESQMWTLESLEPLVDMDNPEATFATGETSLEFWERCAYGTEHRFLIDGYYHRAPGQEQDSGDERCVYWRSPGVHIPYNYVLYGNDRAAYDLGYVQLYLSSLNMEKEGYYKSLPENPRLKDEYALPGGYFDARLNAHMGVALVAGYEKYQDSHFLEQAKRLLHFYKEFLQENHYPIADGGPDVGWLAQDYWHGDGGYESVYASMNHQLQAIRFLYMIGDAIDDKEAVALADRLLLGLELSGDIWMMADGDLHCAYAPGGMVDCEEVSDSSYVDLYRLQELLKETKRGNNKVLDRLMEAKKQYLDREDIAVLLP